MGARDVARVGYFGSLVSGRWGVGSDVELVVIVASSDQSPERRALAFDTSMLPVPADLVVYTREAWERLTADRGSPLGPVVWLDG